MQFLSYTSFSLFTFMRWRRKWQPTPVFLPRESQGWGSLVCCRLWGHTESDTTEVTQQQQQPRGLSYSPIRHISSIWCCHLVFSFRVMPSTLKNIIYCLSLCYLQIYLRMCPYNTNSIYLGLPLCIWFNIISAVPSLSISFSKSKPPSQKVTIRDSERLRRAE